MGTTSSTPSQPSTPSRHRALQAPPAVIFTSWPVRQSWPVACGVTGSVVVTGLAVWIVVQSVLCAAAAVAVILVGLWRSLVPITYELGSFGITIDILGRVRRISWSAVGTWEVVRGGIVITPRPRPAPIDRLGGLFLPWEDRQQGVLASFRYYAPTLRSGDIPSTTITH